MNRVRSILLPTDFSPVVSRISPGVRDLVKRFQARLVIVHAFDLAPEYAIPVHFTPRHEPFPRPLPYTPELHELRSQHQHRLDEFAQREFAGLTCTARIEDGDPAGIVEWVARAESIGLIVMPTRGHGKFRRLLLGSVTAKVLHDTSFPVLTTAHQSAATLAAGGDFGCILCAVEINREAENILAAGSLFAETYGARLSVVHVESQSSVAEGIQHAAVEENAALVVVGRGHEKDRLARVSSALYEIIRQSPCPVLSV